MQYETTVEKRAGFNGVGVWQSGRRAEPFTMTSMVAVGSHAAAMDEHKAYREAVNQSPVQITWRGEQIDSGETLFIVLAVGPPRIAQMATAVGFDNENATHRLEVQWTLIAVDNLET